MLDHFGREVEVDDHILYAVRHGSTHWLKDGIVVRMSDLGGEEVLYVELQTPKGKRVYPYTTPGRFVILNKPTKGIKAA